VKLAGVLAIVLGCTQPATSSSSDQPVLSGDVCAIYTTASTCADDSACTWLGTGCACPPDDPNCGCPAGTCAQSNGSDAGAPTCACADGGVCVAQDGQALACMTPEPGSGDPCTRIEGLTCQASSTIAGLCVCT
jgi:hypothetical protein